MSQKIYKETKGTIKRHRTNFRPAQNLDWRTLRSQGTVHYFCFVQMELLNG